MEEWSKKNVIKALVQAVDETNESTSEFMLFQIACRILCRDEVQGLDSKLPEIVGELMGINHAIENIR